MYLNKLFHSCVLQFFSIQVLSTVEESVRQTLLMTSPQSQTMCGGSEVCVILQPTVLKESIVSENPLKKVLLLSSLQPRLCTYCIMTKFIIQD